jgi:lipoprotein-releasing system permease protein
MYKLFLTLRYLRKRRIAYFAIGAVTLCVAMVLIVMSVMGGFLDQLKSKARGLLGDIILDNRSYGGFPLYDEFIADIRKWPEIEQATPVIYSYGLLRFPKTEKTATVRVVGIRLSEAYQVNAFRSSLYYEQLYPGTTTLADQQMPLLGQSEQAARDGQPDFNLPPELEAALKVSRAAGIRDPDTVDSEFNAFLREQGYPAIPGVYSLNTGEAGRYFGAPAWSGDPRPGIIIGRDIVARRLPDGRYERYVAYPRGSLVTVTLLPMSSGGAVVDTPVKQPFRYADDSRTGVYEIDSQHVYVDFDLLQKLLDIDAAQREDGRPIPARCHQVQIKLRPEALARPGFDTAAFARKLQEHFLSFLGDPRFAHLLDDEGRTLLSYVEGLNWEESQAHIIGPVEKERVLMSIVLGVISLVAVVLVLCILYMIVLQKTRDIGIVKSLGGSSAGVAAIFISYGAAVGVVGSALGALGGIYFVRHINDIQDLLIAIDPRMRVWDLAVYSFDKIPSTVRISDVVLVIVAAIVASTLGSLAAAWRAGSMQPVEALRWE